MIERPPCPTSSDAVSWSLLAIMTALVALFGLQTPFSIVPGSAALPAAGLSVLVVTALVGHGLGNPRLRAAAIAFLQLTLFTMLGVMLSYMVAARAGPLVDAKLATWDAALMVDWPAIRSAVDGSSLVAWLLGASYYALIPQMIVIVVGLSFLHRFEVLRFTVAAATVSGIVTVLLSGLMPAAGNLFDPARYAHLWTPVALTHAPLIAGLRDGSVRVLDLGAMQGIVTFPSYHATLGALFLWAFRSIPKLALPGSLSAALTVLATPLGGGHYAVDVLAGLALAPISLACAALLVGGGAPFGNAVRVFGRGSRKTIAKPVGEGDRRLRRPASRTRPGQVGVAWGDG